MPEAGCARRSCRWCIRRGTRRWTSARRSASSAASRRSCTCSSWICRTRTRRSSRRIRPRRRKRSCDGHVSAFAFFGGVPQSILYDNTKLAVAPFCGDGTRERTQAFTGLVSHYLFARSLRPSRQGQRQGQGRGAGQEWPPPVPDAGAVCVDSYRRVERQAGSRLPAATGTAVPAARPRRSANG